MIQRHFHRTVMHWLLVAMFVTASCSSGDPGKKNSGTGSEEPGVRVVREYYPDGRLKSETEAIGKLRHGISKEYRKDGTLEALISYENNRKHGPAKNFYADGKTVKTEITYMNGYKHGVAKWYYPGGHVYRETPYVNGSISGLRKVYYEDGSLQAEIPYRDGQPGMGLKEYRLDGTLKAFDARIRFGEEDRIGLDNSFRLTMYLSDGTRSVEFFKGQLSEGGFWNDGLSSIPASNGVGVMEFHIPKGSFKMETINVVARVKTNLGHYHILQREYHLALENKF